MANCIFCGKKISLLSAGAYTIKEGKEPIKCCKDCCKSIHDPLYAYATIDSPLWDLTDDFEIADKDTLYGYFKSKIETPDASFDIGFDELYSKWEESYKNRLLKKAEEFRTQSNKEVAMARMLITSGFSFDGYKVVKYSGYISGDDATQVPRSKLYADQDNGKQVTDALVKIRRNAIKELKEAAYDLGCNAVIGVDFDYLTLEPETVSGGTHYLEPYVICVTANGNAVIIEKE